MINRRGVVFHELLFIAVFAPTVTLLTEKWALWFPVQIIGIVIAYIYSHNFPSIVRYKTHYWGVQFLGLLFGSFVYFFPKERMTLFFFWLLITMVLFGKILYELVFTLSNREKQKK